MASSQNTMRDMKRSILKAVRDSQRTKQDAMDEYVAQCVNIKSLETSLEKARAKAALLRRKAKDAGNSPAELKTADELIDAQWAGTTPQPEPAETGSHEDAQAEPALPVEGDMPDVGPAVPEGAEGVMPGEPAGWEGGER